MSLEIAPGSVQEGPGATENAFWAVLGHPGAFRPRPGGAQATSEAPQMPPKASKHRPRSAPGCPRDPKDTAEAPPAALDWLFLVAKGLLDSSPTLLQKSTFSYVNSMVLEGSGTPESSLGALGSVAFVSFGASLRRFGVFGSLAQGLEALI